MSFICTLIVYPLHSAYTDRTLKAGDAPAEADHEELLASKAIQEAYLGKTNKD